MLNSQHNVAHCLTRTMRRVISLFKVTNAIVNLVFCTPLRTTLPSASKGAHTDRHIRTISGLRGRLFVQIVQPKSKQETLFWTTCLS